MKELSSCTTETAKELIVVNLRVIGINLSGFKIVRCWGNSCKIMIEMNQDDRVA